MVIDKFEGGHFLRSLFFNKFMIFNNFSTVKDWKITKLMKIKILNIKMFKKINYKKAVFKFTK